MQAQEPDKQIEFATELRNEISKLVDAANPQGPFFLGANISFVDIQFAPWIIRMRRVLTPYRGWPQPEEGSRWARWVDAIERNESVTATTSTDDLYLDSYERYAGESHIRCGFLGRVKSTNSYLENRPDTSQLANAVNSGRGLP